MGQDVWVCHLKESYKSFTKVYKNRQKYGIIIIGENMNDIRIIIAIAIGASIAAIIIVIHTIRKIKNTKN